ncbi:hypothetical protein [Thermosulfurimonas dismutans]|uniref:Uncharacterized protein n=1 Tax=Thermosulfurimonas dismutans TaxID=999894 RepID=A0A179D524_9BACT|nr:hypothetical protein [Thermosulfurimonas dismutans]OAQ21185.1 hypothetical protein TDIS_0837 [Thermosulfurimonas dismutans]
MTISGYEDLAESLVLEIKREIAERYFTHRKVIEEEIEDYGRKLKEFEKEEENLLKELIRLAYMLRDKNLLKRFEEITGVSLEPYYDEYILSSKNIRRRLFKELKSKGFTSKRKFIKLFEQTYKRLLEKNEAYRKKFDSLKTQAELIEQDIKEFNKEYDLGSIFSFLGSLGERVPSEIAGIEEKDKVIESLGTQLQFPKIRPPEEKFVHLGTLPSWKEVGSELLGLAKEAYRRHTGEAKEILEVLSS